MGLVRGLTVSRGFATPDEIRRLPAADDQRTCPQSSAATSAIQCVLPPRKTHFQRIKMSGNGRFGAPTFRL
jgi:hypothetical protein